MAARGSIAKQRVIEKIKATFGNDFISVDGSKVYVWANDGSERVQIALALTCPKTFVGEAPPPNPNDFTASSMDKIDSLMKKLGITEE